MSRAELLFLKGKAKGGKSSQGLADGIGLMAYDNHDVVDHSQRRLHNIPNHGHPGYLVEHLGSVRLHTGAFTSS
jgi:hypothetical protein